jgi:hypothetical protein
MAGGGAAVAAIAAARQRRIQEAVDAFRLGDATSPERGRTLGELGLEQTREIEDLFVEGVLVPGQRQGTFYLSEAAYIDRRNDRRGLKVVLIATLIVLAIGLFFAARTIPS